ncbi:hypothetical protein CERSUDRAFT_27674, partial [Gelatoporia subvermispora B]
LNEEQRRAFVIAARQLHYKYEEPLCMYLDGMGGTGKSRVLLALIYFLEKRGERGQLLVLAPTGSAACLVDSYTYHSALGIGQNADKKTLVNQFQIAKIRERHGGVDMIFIDEVSMISCNDLYQISSQL